MIKEFIRELRTVDDKIWGSYTFLRDPLCYKVTDREKEEMIVKANECGYLEAVALKNKYGLMHIRQYAEQLGMTISEMEEGNSEDYILFARYNVPNVISVHRNNVKKAEELVIEEEFHNIIDGVNIEDVLIAHEMFHFIECSSKNIYTKTKKIMLWKLGPIKYNSGLVALSEIAAMAFARELLQLSFNPTLFDVLLLYPHDKKKAKALYEEVCAMKGLDSNV